MGGDPPAPAAVNNMTRIDGRSGGQALVGRNGGDVCACQEGTRPRVGGAPGGAPGTTENSVPLSTAAAGAAVAAATASAPAAATTSETAAATVAAVAAAAALAATCHKTAVLLTAAGAATHIISLAAVADTQWR